MNEKIAEKLVESLELVNQGIREVPEVFTLLADDVSTRGLVYIGYAGLLILLGLFILVVPRRMLLNRWKTLKRQNERFDAGDDPIICTGLVFVAITSCLLFVGALLSLLDGLAMWASPNLWLLEKMI